MKYLFFAMSLVFILNTMAFSNDTNRLIKIEIEIKYHKQIQKCFSENTDNYMKINSIETCTKKAKKDWRAATGNITEIKQTLQNFKPRAIESIKGECREKINEECSECPINIKKQRFTDCVAFLVGTERQKIAMMRQGYNLKTHSSNNKSDKLKKKEEELFKLNGKTIELLAMLPKTFTYYGWMECDVDWNENCVETWKIKVDEPNSQACKVESYTTVLNKGNWHKPKFTPSDFIDDNNLVAKTRKRFSAFNMTLKAFGSNKLLNRTGSTIKVKDIKITYFSDKVDYLTRYKYGCVFAKQSASKPAKKSTSKMKLANFGLYTGSFSFGCGHKGQIAEAYFDTKKECQRSGRIIFDLSDATRREWCCVKPK